MEKTLFIFIMEPKLILKSLLTIQQKVNWLFSSFLYKPSLFTIATSLPRLPKFSTHFQQSLYVLLPGQQFTSALTFIELVGQREIKLLHINCTSF